MNTHTVLALDISSTFIGMCYDGQPLDTLKLPEKATIAAKCRLAAAMVRTQICLTPNIDMVVIEAPFIHPKHPNSVIPQARVSGAVLAMLDERELAWYEISPSEVKKALTGKSNASKDLMILTASSRLQAGSLLDEHQADAYGLWVAARQLKVEKVAA